MNQKGFTLVETVIALILATTILVPASLWLYHSRASRAALARFHAAQALEAEMHKAQLLRRADDAASEIAGPPWLRVEIGAVADGDEMLLIGTATDRRGVPLARLRSAWFRAAP